MRNYPLSRRAIISLIGIVVLLIGTTLAVTTTGASNLASLQAGIFAFLGGGSSQVGNFESVVVDPSVTTNKADYAPGETVLITGVGFGANDVVTLQVTDTGPALKVTGTNPAFESALASGYGTWTVNADSSGAFTASWLVGVESLNRQLLLTASGSPSGLSASTTFTDAIGVGTYDQCANDDGDGLGTPPNSVCDPWTNGNLQSNNSTYAEGDSTPQRLWLTGIPAGTEHSVTFKYGTSKGGKHAYDFLTTYNDSENWLQTADLCDAGNDQIPGCETAFPGADTIDIPQDPNVPNTFELAVGDRKFTMAGGDMSLVSTPTVEGGFVNYSGDTETLIEVTFTVPNSGPMCVTQGQTTTCGVVIWFGAHISKTDDWTGPLGDGRTGATTISGSPYHVAFAALDDEGTSGGGRDNQMQANAVVVVPEGEITIVKDAVPDSAQNFTYTTAVSNGGTPIAPFDLDDDADPGLPNTTTKSGLTAGTYDITEGAGRWLDAYFAGHLR
jgi:hypothetical protein